MTKLAARRRPGDRSAFAAKCGFEHQGRQQTLVFDNPGEFERHMATEHRRRPMTEPKILATIRAAIRRRSRTPRRSALYEPGAYDPGARVIFAQLDDADEIQARDGTVWSAGPQARSWWVQPDDDPANPVLVKIYKRPLLSDKTPLSAIPDQPVTRWRDTIARIENLRAASQIFPVGDSAETLSWHTDRDCPLAAGKKPPSERGPVGVDFLIRGLLDQSANASRTRYCRRCIWLDDTAERAA